jgi:hypothetical protein
VSSARLALDLLSRALLVAGCVPVLVDEVVRVGWVLAVWGEMCM